MGRSNKEQAEQVNVSEQEVISEFKNKRREEALAKKALKKGDVDTREAFRKYFAQISGKLSLEKSMEHILWLHLKASGFAEKEKFEEGIKHFGYKI